jgi:hypothetical protein
MFRVGICSLLKFPELTRVLQWCSDVVIVRDREDVKEADFVRDAPAKRAPIIWLLSQSEKCCTLRFFLTGCHSTHSLINWHDTRECKQTEEHSVLPTEISSV